ncbi:MAG: phosphatidylserine decarboxylase [Legionella sp.]|nr:phosphatidylserine decarboxylase [Legionella sp.]
MFQDYIKIATQQLLPKRILTSFAGLMANAKIPAVKNFLIRRFIEVYQVNMQEAQFETSEEYACFNDFFIRQLKPSCRPLGGSGILSPVDGFISEFGTIEKGMLLQAKGRHYSVSELLNDHSNEVNAFEGGQFATLYLSPKDYHRIHMPLDARLKYAVYVPGKLFSVQPSCARLIPRLFNRNERLVLFFETKIGLMAMVLVGATIVGSIATKWHGELPRKRHTYVLKDVFSNLEIKQGEEMGYFKLGSTVILLFSAETPIEWLGHLNAGTPLRYGENLANL